jgi:2-keto-myo-inositol isomerase
MLIGLNGATTMKNADLVTDIELAEKAKYDLLEIWKAKLNDYLIRKDLASLVSLFAGVKIRPYAINSIENITFRNREDFGRVKDETLRLSEIAHRIKCEYLVVVPSHKPPGITKGEIIEESVKSLRQLSKIALSYEVALAFEFIGREDSSVNNLASCWKIVEAVDLDNVGLVVDTFHFYLGGSSLESLQKVDPEKIFIFHINDSEDLPRDELEDKNRLLPGKGIIPLREIAKGLQGIGYNKMVSVELFRPEYWRWDPEKLAKEARQTTMTVLKGLFF